MRKGSFHFLELPVYRLSEEKYNEEQRTGIDSAVKASHDPPITPSSPSIAKRFARSDDNYRERLRKTSGAWRYNEIIGYVRLHLIFSRIHAEYWAKRTPFKGRKKKFERRLRDLAPATELPTTGSKEEICLAILEHVDDCRKELKNHYIDAEQLKTICPYVDWCALFEWD